MTKKLLVLLALSILCTSCQGKQNLEVGGKTPQIKISKWLGNEPSLNGKLVVIDFWFINCAPCVASIPHLNDLVAQYKNEKVAFLAVTDDSQKKVEDFQRKRKIKMESFIGLDPNGKLERKFGVEAFPQSYIIAANGTLLWSGSPLLLSTALLDKFLGTTKSSLTSKVAEYSSEKEHLIIRKTTRQSGGNKLDGPSEKQRRSVFLGNTISQFISAVSPFEESRIVVNEEISTLRYDITHEDFDYDSDLTSYYENLLTRVLEALDISSKTEDSSTEGLAIEVADAAKLRRHKTSKQRLMINDNSIKGAITIQRLAREIEKRHGQFVQFDSSDDQRYNFDIDLTEMTKFSGILQSKYGLTLSSQKITLQKLVLTKK